MDSGATSHMCYDCDMFTELNQSGPCEKLTLGDGSSLEVTGEGTVCIDMVLSDESERRCTLKRVLYIPKLAYNLVSVLRAAQMGKSVLFDDSTCEFVNEAGETFTISVRQGSLYYLKCTQKLREGAYTTRTDNKERLWHRRFGHLNEQSMWKLV